MEQICLLMSSFTWSVIEKLLIILDELGQRFLRVFPGARMGLFQSWLVVPVIIVMMTGNTILVRR